MQTGWLGVKLFVVHAAGCEWGMTVAVCTSRSDAEAFIVAVERHRDRAPKVDWDWENEDPDKVARYFDRLERFKKRCPGGDRAFDADLLAICAFRVWQPASK